MRRAVAVAMALAWLIWSFFIAVPKLSAFPLTTCTLDVTSHDASGKVISTATGNGPGGTRDAPLIVDPNGTVEWTGTTGGSPITNASYHVEVFDVPTPLQGSTHDDSPRSTSSGSVDVGKNLPFDLVGLIYVSGAVDVDGSPYCVGSGWIQMRGDPVGTPGFIAGVGLSLVGLAGVLASVRGRHAIRGALAGLVGGAGLALLSGVNSILPLDEKTPVAEVIGMVILGLVIGVIDFGSLFGGGSVQAVRQAEAPEPDTKTAEPPAVPATQETTPTTAVVPPVVVQPPVTPPPVIPPSGPAPSTAPSTGTPAPAAPLKPGLETIRAGVDGLPPPVKEIALPLFTQAEVLLKHGPGTMSIGSDVAGRLMAQTGMDPSSVRLVDGAIEADEGLLTAKVKPVVTNGMVTLDLNAEATAADAMGRLDGLRRFLDNANRAVADAGLRVTSVSVGPTGITVTTGPGTPPAPVG